MGGRVILDRPRLIPAPHLPDTKSTVSVRTYGLNVEEVEGNNSFGCRNYESESNIDQMRIKIAIATGCVNGHKYNVRRTMQNYENV